MPIRDRKRFVAVYPERSMAERAAEDLRARGLTPSIDASDDEVLSLRAEMQEEASKTMFAAGNIGPFTKEMQRSIVANVTLYAILGALLVTPAGFIPVPGASLGFRLAIAAMAGAVAGAVIGFVLGGGLGMKGHEAELAAERGVTLSVEVPEEQTDEVIDVLDRPRVIRLDQLSADGVVEKTVETEETRGR